MIVDGENAVLGRLATNVAKTLLKGEDVSIVNAEKIIIIGRAQSIIEEYRELRTIGSPKKGPFFPKSPDRLVRRVIRSMLPYKTRHGKESLKKLDIHVGFPEELRKKETKKIAVKEVRTSFVTLEDVSRSLGWINA
jgi:large subunit ribosomal protein L13